MRTRTPHVWPSRSARTVLGAQQRRARSRRQKPDPSFAQSLRGLIIQSGCDGAERRSSTGSPSPLRSPAACRCAVIDNRTIRQPEHRSSRVCRGSSSLEPPVLQRHRTQPARLRVRRYSKRAQDAGHSSDASTVESTGWIQSPIHSDRFRSRHQARICRIVPQPSAALAVQ